MSNLNTPLNSLIIHKSTSSHKDYRYNLVKDLKLDYDRRIVSSPTSLTRIYPL